MSNTDPIPRERLEDYAERGFKRKDIAEEEECSLAHVKRELARCGINLMTFGRKRLPDLERRLGGDDPILFNPTPEDDTPEYLDMLRWENMTKTEKALEILGDRVTVKSTGYFVDRTPVSIYRLLELAGLDT